MGNVPTWLAFTAATVAGVCTWRALVRERRRDVHREKRQSRAQAELVAGWIVEAELSSFPDRKVWVARVGNQSALPIYGVCVEVTKAPGWEPHFVLNDESGSTIPARIAL